MLRHCSCVIALAMMLVGLRTAQAADTTLTLACQGTATGGTEDAKPEPVPMGIIVNFTKKTVHGFGDPIFGEQLIQITGITETAVNFSGSAIAIVKALPEGFVLDSEIGQGLRRARRHRRPLTIAAELFKSMTGAEITIVLTRPRGHSPTISSVAMWQLVSIRYRRRAVTSRRVICTP
jgi:hypothetical protein